MHLMRVRGQEAGIRRAALRWHQAFCQLSYIETGALKPFRAAEGMAVAEGMMCRKGGKALSILLSLSKNDLYDHGMGCPKVRKSVGTLDGTVYRNESFGRVLQTSP